MTKKWDGIERRMSREDGREGRRPADIHCSTHDVLWQHHDDDKLSFRTLTCGKISKLEGIVDKEIEKLCVVDDNIKRSIESLKENIVGKYWFRIVVGFLMLGIAGVGIQQNWAFKEILGNQKELSSTVDKVVIKQIEAVNKIAFFEEEIKRLHLRQDVLRDQHLKIVEKNEKQQR